uniref:E3 ubiquitin-protein ligase SHPRH-like n=1 Tax=Petromyzon marinus TaxID=7757 RepID=A0AAJ7U3X8_PETMA|nr:E3 ubiquitin-protein ligase SHPRH-like [Petromyzon marinus]XP_032829242.1 E3 ubiquitin-protein ligase SHPRH-like [Petromyzon marinus]XP_032829243.1 E3 ubiquitin-protein ligase SHPRH-like [Petromyzon marinus]
MNNRRKRSLPVKVDVEKRKVLCWSLQDELVPTAQPEQGDAARLHTEDSDAIAQTSDSATYSSDVPGRSSDTPGGCSSSAASSAVPAVPATRPSPLRLAVYPQPTAQQEWSAVLLSFELTYSFADFAAQTTDLPVTVTHDPCAPSQLLCECDSPLVRASATIDLDILFDLAWLQRNKVVTLYRQPTQPYPCTVTIFVHMLTAGLSHIEILSEGYWKIKKVNQLLQKLLALSHNFPIPEEQHEEAVTDEALDLQKQNVEALYDYVWEAHSSFLTGTADTASGTDKHVGGCRHAQTNVHSHSCSLVDADSAPETLSQLNEQISSQSSEGTLLVEAAAQSDSGSSNACDIQHPLLVPQLRPYQCQAVQWMLKREHVGHDACSTGGEKKLHPLWKEFSTIDGQTLYCNYYTGSIIKDRPEAAPECPGGILADEMGLGKTIEVLALILAHPRPNMAATSELLPSGVKVNYYIPPPETEKVKEKIKSSAGSPNKPAVSAAGLRTMIVEAFRKAKGRKGVSMSALYRHLSASCGYDAVQKRKAVQSAVRAMLDAGTLQHVKGQGLGGTFRVSKSYREPVAGLTMSARKARAAPLEKTVTDAATSPSVPADGEEQNSTGDVGAGGDAEAAEDKTNIVLRDAPDSAGIVPLSPVTELGIPATLDMPRTAEEAEFDGTSRDHNYALGGAKVNKGNGVAVSDVDRTLNSTKQAANQEREAPPAMKSGGGTEMGVHVEMEPRTPVPIFPFNKKDYRFECVCGELGLSDFKPRVQCMSCGLWQHAACVNYSTALLQAQEGTGAIGGRQQQQQKEEQKEDEEAEGGSSGERHLPFHCAHCLVAMEPTLSGATLIVSPSSISHQWVDEINRHIRSCTLRVLVYNGVKRDGFVQPRKLAQQDVVITTYDVLRSELSYVDLPYCNRGVGSAGGVDSLLSSEGGRRFRQGKRYMALPSPLVAVHWWRVCLDEAQMVERTTAKAAEMALRLSSVNRWCVTGTPVQRGLEDLYGLVLFLGVEPFWVRHWWERLLYRPYVRGDPTPLYRLVSAITWRSSKKHVIDQIELPPQTEDTHWLRFSPVEQHFYQRQHELCSQDALVKLRKLPDWSVRLSALERRTVSSLLTPLLRLRQACCHPQVVRGEFLPLQKSTMTMEELLCSLQRKCKTECEEAHRQLVCALNGLAGIHIINGEIVDAVDKYREVLQSSEEHKEKLKTDSLQRLHATHNLIELLGRHRAGIAPTLRDDRLQEEAEQLRHRYMSKYEAEVREAHAALQPVAVTIRDTAHKVNGGAAGGVWWLDVIAHALRSGQEEELLSRVQNELSSNTKHMPHAYSMADKFRDARGLQLLLSGQLDALRSAREAVRSAVRGLEATPSPRLVLSATVCHLRAQRLPRNSCPFCKADELFTEYESKLFLQNAKGQAAVWEELISEEGGSVENLRPATGRGLWALSETERALRALLAFARATRHPAAVLEEGGYAMDLFDAWKKEYKLLHEYWMMLRNRVSAVDEIAMATERFQVLQPDEDRPDPALPHIIEPGQVEQQRMKLLNDKALAASQLRKKLGQMLYLSNLEKSQDKSGQLNPDPCPICSRNFGKQWVVLQCGHCFCNECTAIQMAQYSVGSQRSAIRCAVCRHTTLHHEVSYVSTVGDGDQADDVTVKGSHSTKVEAVIRELMKIHMSDPEAKSLVFSTWQDVLDIIGKALKKNGIYFAQINGIHRFQENLSAFKHDPGTNVLLLPLHTGSNGLNIIEATHVILVEPILNPATEMQAIGRVHRIGQTRPTVVHRFAVKSTIEEKMVAMLKSAEKISLPLSRPQSDASIWTVTDLADLFADE